MSFLHSIIVAIRSASVLAVLAGSALSAPLPAATVPPDDEQFLRTAQVVKSEPLAIGVTHSHRLTLTDDTRTARTVWKTIDEYQPVKHFGDGGAPEVGYRDSYKSEIAAYELSKVLGMGIVPATVERKIKGQRGSLQLWIEDSINEAERRKQKISPSDPVAWNRQIHAIRLFRQLIYDADYRNISNILSDPQFRVWSVDHSRSFRTQNLLVESGSLDRFSPELLRRLAELSPEVLTDTLGRWLTKPQRAGILKRRDQILALATKLVSERGEDAVYLPDGLPQTVGNSEHP